MIIKVSIKGVCPLPKCQNAVSKVAGVHSEDLFEKSTMTMTTVTIVSWMAKFARQTISRNWMMALIMAISVLVYGFALKRFQSLPTLVGESANTPWTASLPSMKFRTLSFQ